MEGRPDGEKAHAPDEQDERHNHGGSPTASREDAGQMPDGPNDAKGENGDGRIEAELVDDRVQLPRRESAERLKIGEELRRVAAGLVHWAQHAPRRMKPRVRQQKYADKRDADADGGYRGNPKAPGNEPVRFPRKEGQHDERGCQNGKKRLVEFGHGEKPPEKGR